MKKRVVLYADEGKVLTNGVDFCSEIQLAIGHDGSEFYEVSESEYQKILESLEAQNAEV